MADENRLSPDTLREVLLRLEVNQHTRAEMHLAKEDLREYLRIDLDKVRAEVGGERKKLLSIVTLVITAIIGGDIWTIRGTEERLQRVLNEEVEATRLSVKKRLDQEFETPRITALVEDKAREYTTREAKRYITEQVESSLNPYRGMVNAAVRELQTQKSLLDDYQATAQRAAANLNEQQLVSALFGGALSGSRRDFDDLVRTSRTTSAAGQSARKNIDAVKRSLEQYRRPVFVAGGIDITIPDQSGREKNLRDFSALELLNSLQSENEGSEMTRYMMGYLVSKPRAQLIAPSLEALRMSPYLPGLAATCGVLMTVFGERAPFLDVEGWTRFLKTEQGSASVPRLIQK